ncbi:LacI family DNA-binding transcriptional regulator [Carboxylicivirga sp. N1Y90]|uniref:LacI family DNA-binding transcriptional regulator n=1 Tax=Carboxylicivirga fragile TaxID=3417571 RepID=UPI003D33998F|nr:LacI family DNA-binding transcriptional regulator [Marinilabiliaceae bacterium N1Y90]
MKKASIKDIAKHLNVSVPTVSLVMNGRGDEKRISKETQERILKYAQEQNYKPNIFAKGLKKGRSEMLGVIIPNISDVFYARIVSRIEKDAAKHGYTVIFSSSQESGKKESELIRSMFDRQVEGLIIASSQKNADDILALKKINFPFVLVDRHYPDIETDYVIVDNIGGVKSAVNHLVKCGAQRIGFISLKPELDAIKNRFLGYQQGLEDNEMEYISEYVQELKSDTFEEEMSDALDCLLQKHTAVDAIIFSTHYLTTCGIRELRSRNLIIPNDIKIVSFDQFKAFDLLEPPITVVTQPVLDMGDRAVDILLEKLRLKDKVTRQEVLNTGFIVRKSCGEIK